MAAKPEGRLRPEGRPGMRLDSWDGSVLTNEGNAPRPEGRDERRVEGNDWAMAAKPEGRLRPEGRPGMRRIVGWRPGIDWIVGMEDQDEAG